MENLNSEQFLSYLRDNQVTCFAVEEYITDKLSIKHMINGYVKWIYIEEKEYNLTRNFVFFYTKYDYWDLNELQKQLQNNFEDVILNLNKYKKLKEFL